MENETENNDVEAMQAALKKANDEAKTYRLERNSLKEELDRAQTASQEFKAGYVQMKAEKALAEAGLSNGKAAKYLDYSKVTVTDAGELEGLAEQLESLKEDLPELFATTKSLARGADASDRREAQTQKRSADKLIANLHKN